MGVVGVVKEPPTDAWSSPLLKVWSRLDTGFSRQNRVAALVGAFSGRGAAREVSALDDKASVGVGHGDLVVPEVVDYVARIALALGAGGLRLLHCHSGCPFRLFRGWRGYQVRYVADAGTEALESSRWRAMTP
jgi:hypothetical protein